MHEYEFFTTKEQKAPWKVYLDKEELNPLQNECVVIGSTIYRVIGVIKTPEKVQVQVEKVGDKLYVGMLSEW